uniref:Uncharacterized protein n=1 Tax=Rhizophora mucronata TaxID=61149 RepID=A0A2P2PXQ6_RHIMU
MTKRVICQWMEAPFEKNLTSGTKMKNFPHSWRLCKI